jgi:large subunit ribosomal protein L10
MGAKPVKEKFINKLAEDFQRSKGIYLAEGVGISSNEMNSLRKSFRDVGARYLIAKNTLAKRAFKIAGMEKFDSDLKGSTAIVIAFKDALKPAKILSDFSELKENKDKFRLRSCMVDGSFLSSRDVARLATIPSREVLLSQLLSVLNAPMRNLACALSGIIRNVPSVISAVARKKENESK